MKILRYWWMCVFCLQAATAQSVGIGTATPDASARLEVNSTSQGILIPKMTAAQRVAITNAATGLLVFQTDGMPGFYWYNGTEWISMTTGQAISNSGASATYHLVNTYAGTTISGFADGVGTAARFSRPSGMVSDAAGNLYVADMDNHRIRKIAVGGSVTTFAGNGTPGTVDGQGAAAQFNFPSALAIDATGNLYVADMQSNAIRKITPGGHVTTIAAAVNMPGSILITTLLAPISIAVDVGGTIYYTEVFGHRIRAINSSGITSVMAGDVVPGFDDGVGPAARFRNPVGLAVDADRTVYVADAGNNCIRKVLRSRAVSTLAGSGQAGLVDGFGGSAQFNKPQMVALDASGNLYVADANTNCIRKVSLAGNTTTLAGSGIAGGANGPVRQAQFINPFGIAIDAAGNIFISESGSHTIRNINKQ